MFYVNIDDDNLVTGENYMAHHCKYFVAHCIDFRFGKAINNYLERGGVLGDCDIVSIAGSVKDTDFILSQLDISMRLHNVQEIILINHIDCGAYGGSGKFSSFAEERAFQSGELKRAKTAILAKYPALKIKVVLARISSSGETIFEEL